MDFKTIQKLYDYIIHNRNLYIETTPERYNHLNNQLDVLRSALKSEIPTNQIKIKINIDTTSLD